MRIPLQTFCFRNAEAQMAETGFLVEGLQPGHNTRSVILRFLRFLLGGPTYWGKPTHDIMIELELRASDVKIKEVSSWVRPA